MDRIVLPHDRHSGRDYHSPDREHLAETDKMRPAVGTFAMPERMSNDGPDSGKRSAAAHGCRFLERFG
jgi:hypothetical protein